MKFNKNKIQFYYILKLIFIFLLLFLLSIILFISKNKIDFVAPTVSSDFRKIIFNFKLYKKYLKFISNFVFIGNEEVEKLIKNEKLYFKLPLKFINEKNLINIDKIKNLIKSRNISAAFRSGWYIQQFLKMQYHKICKNKYYLIWDSDTIPVKEINKFNNNGKPYFEFTGEYNKFYFDLIERVFSIRKKNNFSFISEHMLIKTEIMKNLINTIDINRNISGEIWYEKIINSIDPTILHVSGFSEYETYGTFTSEYYNTTYDLRPWSSLRTSNYDYKNLTENNVENLAKSYNAVSIENWD